jgi:hypothetical protein
MSLHKTDEGQTETAEIGSVKHILAPIIITAKAPSLCSICMLNLHAQPKGRNIHSIKHILQQGCH